MNNPVTKMIVRNLSPQTTVKSLGLLFADFGTVRSVSLATDVMTGRCGGLGFVHLCEHKSGAALDELNGKDFGGQVLRVSLEQKQSHSSGRN